MCSFPGIMQARCQNESILFTHFGTFLQNRLQVAASSRKTQKKQKSVAGKLNMKQSLFEL